MEYTFAMYRIELLSKQCSYNGNHTVKGGRLDIHWDC